MPRFPECVHPKFYSSDMTFALLCFIKDLGVGVLLFGEGSVRFIKLFLSFIHYCF